jgi:hypothetical protein
VLTQLFRILEHDLFGVETDLSDLLLGTPEGPEKATRVG